MTSVVFFQMESQNTFMTDPSISPHKKQHTSFLSRNISPHKASPLKSSPRKSPFKTNLHDNKSPFKAAVSPSFSKKLISLEDMSSQVRKFNLALLFN